MSTRAPLSGLGKLTLAGLVAMAIGIVWTMWVSGVFTLLLNGVFIVPAFVSLALALGLAYLVATGIRWMPAVAAVVAAAMLVGALQGPPVTTRLANPADIWPFAATVVHLLSSALVVVAGVGTAVQRYLSSGRAAWRAG